MTWQRQRVFLRRGGEGPVLLLIHGFPTSSWDWHSLWDELCLRHTVIAPDLLGFGSSSKPFPHRYGIDEQAGLVEAVLKLPAASSMFSTQELPLLKPSRSVWLRSPT